MEREFLNRLGRHRKALTHSGCEQGVVAGQAAEGPHEDGGGPADGGGQLRRGLGGAVGAGEQGGAEPGGTTEAVTPFLRPCRGWNSLGDRSPVVVTTG